MLPASNNSEGDGFTSTSALESTDMEVDGVLVNIG